MKYIDLSGKQIGDWFVLERTCSINNMTCFNCKCKCGKICSVYAKHLKSGASSSCHACSVVKGEHHSQWQGAVGGIPLWYWKSIEVHCNKKATKRKQWNLKITIKEAAEKLKKQNYCCALSGIKLNLPLAKCDSDNFTASLDRIDSKKDYTKDNIQWVHKDLNKMKNKFNEQYFVKMCSMVVEHTQKMKS